MSSSRNPRRSRRGSILQGLTLMSMVAVIAAFIGQMTITYSRSAKRKIQDSRAIVSQTSGIELVLLAYRNAELRYVINVAACDSAQPFLQALRKGSGCAVAPPLTIFTGADDGTVDGLYTLSPAGCQITSAGSTCIGPSTEVMHYDVPGEVRAIASEPTTAVYLTSVNPEKQVVEFAAVTATANQRRQKFAFAIRGSLTNAAHLEADGRVTQENPDPLAKCPGSQWATFLLFNPATKKCNPYAQLGSGTGLAYFRGRYFGFRPPDGQVIDLDAASETTSTSYLIGPGGKTLVAGTETGPALFPPYVAEELINVDDITTVGEQLYYVADSGVSAHIGGLKATGAGLVGTKVCDLGSMGWGQAYEGIAALSRSEPIFPATGDGNPTSRISTFFLKTSGGDLLTAVVFQSDPAQPIQCVVMKDQNLQQIEYKRTYGFDRTDQSKPYYQY